MANVNYVLVVTVENSTTVLVPIVPIVLTVLVNNSETTITV